MVSSGLDVRMKKRSVGHCSYRPPAPYCTSGIAATASSVASNVANPPCQMKGEEAAPSKAPSSGGRVVSPVELLLLLSEPPPPVLLLLLLAPPLLPPPPSSLRGMLNLMFHGISSPDGARTLNGTLPDSPTPPRVKVTLPAPNAGISTAPAAVGVIVMDCVVCASGPSRGRFGCPHQRT